MGRSTPARPPQEATGRAGQAGTPSVGVAKSTPQGCFASVKDPGAAAEALAGIELRHSKHSPWSTRGQLQTGARSSATAVGDQPADCRTRARSRACRPRAALAGQTPRAHGGRCPAAAPARHRGACDVRGSGRRRRGGGRCGPRRACRDTFLIRAPVRGGRCDACPASAGPWWADPRRRPALRLRTGAVTRGGP